jgi:hypothetical protein
VVTPGDLVGRLEVRCRRCERHGRLGLAKLIADHGAGTGLPDLGGLVRTGQNVRQHLPW